MRAQQKTPEKIRYSPRQTRAHGTIDVILEAATRILERAGRNAFNTSAVAREAGVSVGTLATDSIR